MRHGGSVVSERFLLPSFNQAILGVIDLHLVASGEKDYKYPSEVERQIDPHISLHSMITTSPFSVFFPYQYTRSHSYHPSLDQ